MTLSYGHGLSTVRLLNDTLGGCFGKAAERWPGREAVMIRDPGVR